MTARNRLASTRSRLACGSVAVLACSALALAGSGAAASTAASAAAPGGPLAVQAKTCKPPKYPGVGYFSSINVTNTTCATGTKLVVAYYKCRTRSGAAGRCKSTVLGFKCTEVRQSIPDEIDARDTCKLRRETVVSTWQQDVD